MDACKECPYKVACMFDPGFACFLDDIPHFFDNLKGVTVETNQNSY